MYLQSVVEELDPEVVEELPPDVVRQLRDGVIDEIPEEVVNRLPPELVDKVPSGVIDFASDNPTLAIVLGVIGVVAVLFLFWGIAKQAMRTVVMSGVAAAVAWYFFFQA